MQIYYRNEYDIQGPIKEVKLRSCGAFMGSSRENSRRTNFLRKKIFNGAMNKYIELGQQVVPLKVKEITEYISDCDNGGSGMWEWCNCRSELCNAIGRITMRRGNN